MRNRWKLHAPAIGFLLLGSATLIDLPLHADILNNSISVHDPSRMVYSPENGRWYIFYTGNGTPIMSSPDQVTWSRTNSDRVWPSTVDNFNYWAPDMWDTPIHGKYYLFYSESSFGSQNSFIRVASTTSLANPVWTKDGVAVQSVQGQGRPLRFNAIDPCPWYDSAADRLWLTFGSFWDGIFIVELDPLNPTVQLSTPLLIAGGRPGPNAIEGSFLFKRGAWFYVVNSVDTCCQGSGSTYKMVLGRSADITGPYYDREWGRSSHLWWDRVHSRGRRGDRTGAIRVV